MNWLLTGESSDMQSNNLCQLEENLLCDFRKLSKSDQQEIYDFIQLMILRAKQKASVKLSTSELNNQVRMLV